MRRAHTYTQCGHRTVISSLYFGFLVFENSSSYAASLRVCCEGEVRKRKQSALCPGKWCVHWVVVLPSHCGPVCLSTAHGTGICLLVFLPLYSPWGGECLGSSLISLSPALGLECGGCLTEYMNKQNT